MEISANIIIIILVFVEAKTENFLSDFIYVK